MRFKQASCLSKIFLVATILAHSCTSFNAGYKTYDQLNIKDRVYNKITVLNLDKNKILSDIKKFKNILKTGRKLNESDLKLHDSLFEIYKNLKYRPQNNILILPAYTQINIQLNSYCLDDKKASPENLEIFQWSKSRSNSWYLEGLLKLSSQKKYSQNVIQEIIWNIENNTYWKNYPVEHQKILKEIDTNVEEKIPNALSGKFKSKLKNEILKNVPADIQDQVNYIHGEFYNYSIIKEQLENRKSNKPLPEHRLTKIQDHNNIYTSHLADSFYKQTVSFYNLNDASVKIDISLYEQHPYRTDVQRIAVYYENDPDFADLFQQLEILLYSDMARLGYGFIPIVNDLIDLYEATTGKDFFTNDTLSSMDRFLSVIAVLAGNAEAYRQAAKILHGPPSYMTDQLKKERRAKNPESLKALEKLADELSTKGLPDTWRTEPSKIKKANQGWEYTHPDNSDIRIRVMPGNPNSPHKNSQKPYVIVQKNTDLYDKNGNIGKRETDDTHIPIEDFDIKIFKRILKR